VTLAEVFFPAGNPTVSLLVTFVTFGAFGRASSRMVQGCHGSAGAANHCPRSYDAFAVELRKLCKSQLQ
jgi:hypothetical protein